MGSGHGHAGMEQKVTSYPASIREYPVSFELVDRSLNHRLLSCLPSAIEFQRQQTTGASTVYQLYDKDVGYIGKITVRNIGQGQTLLEVLGPVWEQRKLGPEELAEIEAVSDPGVKRKTRASLVTKILQEAQDSYYLCARYNGNVTRSLLSGLDNDLRNAK